jgi:ankyrin repeat protein
MLHVQRQSEYFLIAWYVCRPPPASRRRRQGMETQKGNSMKLTTRACLFVCVLMGPAGVLQAEPSWPGLTPDLWNDMTPKEMERLLSEGNDISQRDGVGMTALMRAAQYNRDPHLLRLLLDRGAQVDVRDQGGWTPLMRAARSNPNPEIHAILIAAGADVNGRNMAEYTALIWATRENPNPDVVLLLLDAGANPAVRGVDGRRAVDFLAENRALAGTLAAERLRGE